MANVEVKKKFAAYARTAATFGFDPGPAPIGRREQYERYVGLWLNIRDGLTVQSWPVKIGAQAALGHVTQPMCVVWADDEKTGNYLFADSESKRMAAKAEEEATNAP